MSVMTLTYPRGYPNHERYDPDNDPDKPNGLPYERYDPDKSNGLP